jgi:hypothetical protein
MSTNATIPISNLDINKVSFGDIRMNKAGGKTVPIRYNGQNFEVRIPSMNYPMGIRIKQNDNGTAYTMSASMQGCDPFAKKRAGSDAGDIGNFYNFLLDLQEKLVSHAVDNSVKWFGKSRKEDVIRDTMKQLIDPSVEKVNGEWVATGKYPPSLRMKVPVYQDSDGKTSINMDVINASGQNMELTLDTLPKIFAKQTKASLVVSPSIYVSGQGFGVTWRITFARVASAQRRTARDVFADEIEEEEIGSGSTVAQTEEEQTEEQTEEEQVEETPTAPPAPAPAAPAAAKNRRRVVAAS